MTPGAHELLHQLLARCTFDDRPGVHPCAFSGGADSTALVALARHAGFEVIAHHVDHGLRPESAAEAEQAAHIADALGAKFVCHVVSVEPGPNLEARARAARYAALPPDVMTGHTMDDQAETVLLRLLRGSGAAGMAGIEPGSAHPLLALRRSDTEALCRALAVVPNEDASNRSPTIQRNRIRHELLPLASEIASRDVVPILARTASILREQQHLIDELASALDATDAKALASADPAVARQAIRRWLTVDGYPPDVAGVDRVMAVARGEATACELPGGRRLERSGQRFRIVEPPH